jgi:hypothetical protein
MEITGGIPIIFPDMATKFATGENTGKFFRVGYSTHKSQIGNMISIGFCQETIFETNFEMN